MRKVRIAIGDQSVMVDLGDLREQYELLSKRVAPTLNERDYAYLAGLLEFLHWILKSEG